jgi:hypothetical protein
VYYLSVAVRISGQTLTSVLSNVKRVVFMSEMESVYCVEQLGSLMKTDYILCLKVKESVMFILIPYKAT